MTTPLLVTKMHIPQLRPGLLARPHLIERLNSGLIQRGAFTRKLTLVSAPAGFGKTTLIVQWLSEMVHPVAWLSLDESDGDPVRFLAYLVAAVAQTASDFGTSVQNLLQAPQPPAEKILLSALINELAGLQQSLFLVLDDYHSLQNQAVHRQLNVHLVIVTREDPPLPLSRLRAQGQVLEIRQSDLRFTHQEVADFLHTSFGLKISAEDVQALAKRTEGWAVGLHMAALSLQNTADKHAFVQSFKGSHRFILDYLLEEVLERQPDHLRAFLQKTSILERLSAPLCDALTGRSDSSEILDHLEESNAFILALDPYRHWYRYHHLFAELLRHRLRHQDTSQEETLHLKASRWFEQNAYPVEAVRHALAAGDWERSGDLILKASENLLKRGEVTTILTWYRRIPEDQIVSRPLLALSFSWPLVLSGQLESAQKLLEQVEQQVGDKAEWLGEIAAVQAYIARSRGDDRRTVMLSEKALSLLPQREQQLKDILSVNLGIAYWHTGHLKESRQVMQEAFKAAQAKGNQYVELTAQIFLNRVLAASGQLREAFVAYQPLAAIDRPIPVLALVHMDVATLYYEWNDLRAARHHLEKCLAIAAQTASGEFLISGHTQMARLFLAQNDMQNSLEELSRTEQMLATQTVTPLNRARTAAVRVQAALRRDDLEGAAQWLEQAGSNADAHPFYPFLGLTPARYLLAQNRKGEALAYLDDCLKRAEQAGWGYGQIAIKVLQAQAARQPDEAQEYLLQALEWAQPAGYVRTFVDAGPSLSPLLEEAALQGANPQYLKTLLSALAHEPSAERESGPITSLIEPLSERETEVLRLAAAGLSNRQIAAKLIISLGTVKTHMHNIYSKLNASNRTQAVATARESGLI
ncbi:MAG: LuxR C-terminal-related transcriptional regulator [Anaerolineales bacterium]